MDYFKRLSAAAVVAIIFATRVFGQGFQQAKPMITADFECDAGSAASTCQFKVFMSNGTGIKYFAVRAHNRATIGGLLAGDPYVVTIDHPPPDTPSCAGASYFCLVKAVHPGTDN